LRTRQILILLFLWYAFSRQTALKSVLLLGIKVLIRTISVEIR
jgi:hypothetical protein